MSLEAATREPTSAHPEDRAPGRERQRGGLVLRTVYPEVPTRVEYELTPLGQTLRGPLRALTEWSVRHIEEVLAAREEYDGRAGKR
jgi:DNA-binding HxlR family transcriptional regulator